MDGLDCRELLLSFILSSSDSARIDSHFFEKKYEKVVSLIRKVKHKPLSEIVEKPIQTGHTPPMKEERYYGGNIAFIKTNNLREGFITTPFDNYLTDEGNATIDRTSLQEGDIITTIIGASEKVIARSAIITNEYLPANINQNIVQLRVNKDIVSPEFVYVYLNSYYGKQYLYYYSRQMEQVNLNCDEVGSVEIPIFSKQFIDLVTRSIIQHNRKKSESIQIYNEAELILEKEIGIDMSILSNDRVSVKSFSESFGYTGRLDAEYYQKKHYEVIDKISAKGTVKTLCNIHDKTFIPINNESYKYIELSNIGKSGNIDGVESIIGRELPSRARRWVKKGNVIVSSIEGSLESCAIITDSYDNALCSSGFYVIDSKEYNSETLLVLLKSKPIQMLLKRSCSGTILTNITKDEFLQLPLPDVSQITQNTIKDKVSMAFQLRGKSKELLEFAKQSIELAIEKDEATAIAWLEAKIKE